MRKGNMMKDTNGGNKETGRMIEKHSTQKLIK